MSNTRKIVACVWQSALVFLGMGCANTSENAVENGAWQLAPANSATIEGLKINYVSKTVPSQRPTIIFIHGFGASLQTWADVGPLFSSCSIVALDLKGAGFSDKPADGNYAVSDQAATVLRFLEILDLTNVVLVGHSMGGGVALLTYMRWRDNPGRITLRALVLVDSAGYPQKLPFFVSDMRNPALRYLTGFLSPEFRSRYVLERVFWQKEKITAERIERYAFFLRKPAVEQALAQTAKQLVPPNADKLSTLFKKVSIPTLIVWGQHDPVIPVYNAHRFNKDIPNSTLIVLPKAGHVPQEEQPEEFFNAVSAFIGALE